MYYLMNVIKLQLHQTVKSFYAKAIPNKEHLVSKTLYFTIGHIFLKNVTYLFCVLIVNR
jgi:hypothetical protein